MVITPKDWIDWPDRCSQQKTVLAMKWDMKYKTDFDWSDLLQMIVFVSFTMKLITWRSCALSHVTWSAYFSSQLNSLIYFVQVIVEVGIAFWVTNSPVTEHHSRETLKWSTEKPYCHYVPLLFYVVSTYGLSLHDSTMREVVNNLTIFHLISMQNQIKNS